MGSRGPVSVVILLALLGFSCAGQVAPAGSVTDAASRRMQREYVAQLRQLASNVATIRFPYPFYFSTILAIDEARQKQLPQGSIRFDRFNSEAVLAITGNYYISYSADLVNRNKRMRRTYQDVVLPLLKAAVAHVGRDVPIDGYAFEISHHVRSHVLKVTTEGPENLMMMFPRAIAERLVQAKDEETQQSALLESEVYLNGEPLMFWLAGDDAPTDVQDHYLARHEHRAPTKTLMTTEPIEPGTLVSPSLVPEPDLARKIREQRNTPHDVSPATLEKLKGTYAPTLQTMLPALQDQAHFVDYAPPAFIAFRDGAYLQLNVTTDLEQPAGSSQYRIAALAFESHVSHLLRPVTKYFHDKPQFDGVDFSTTVHQTVQPNSLSVEFVVPFPALLCYEKYDCTGQELIDRSVVLINGERVTLDLQRAETDPAPRPR
ncbi:MAG TPA: hypothetical protein VEW69_08340 [Alphaproteobacteria bacterium]|nr:hypothetical protein [Alphaproteobacteria bacterium]